MLRSLAARIGITLSICLLLSSGAQAQLFPWGENDADSGQDLYRSCVRCHGPQGQGRRGAEAPTLAGLQPWYVERQLNNFVAGDRGYHTEDITGRQMARMNRRALSEESAIPKLAAYIGNLANLSNQNSNQQGREREGNRNRNSDAAEIWQEKYGSTEWLKAGDPDAGKEIYNQSCVTCHAADAGGNELQGAPNLTRQASWYLGRQLKYFQDGLRGTAKNDIYGSQMAMFAKLLPDEQATADVVAYIDNLPPLPQATVP